MKPPLEFKLQLVGRRVQGCKLKLELQRWFAFALFAFFATQFCNAASSLCLRYASDWKLITLQNLQVDLKFEFNQNNRQLHGDTSALLGESAIK